LVDILYQNNPVNAAGGPQSTLMITYLNNGSAWCVSSCISTGSDNAGVCCKLPTPTCTARQVQQEVMKTEFFNPSEIAFVLGVDENTVVDLLQDGLLKGRFLQGSWIVHRNALRAFFSPEI